MEMIASNKVIAYCLPQGQIAQLYRAMACGLPGKMSKVGLGTFIDPRVEGGKMNERTRSEPDISEIVEYHGEEYLMYNEVPIDTLLIRGTTCDEMGNMTTTDEGHEARGLQRGARLQALWRPGDRPGARGSRRPAPSIPRTSRSRASSSTGSWSAPTRRKTIA